MLFNQYPRQPNALMSIMRRSPPSLPQLPQLPQSSTSHASLTLEAGLQMLQVEYQNSITRQSCLLAVTNIRPAGDYCLRSHMRQLCHHTPCIDVRSPFHRTARLPWHKPLRSPWQKRHRSAIEARPMLLETLEATLLLAQERLGHVNR